MSDPNDTVVSSYAGGPSELDTDVESFIKETAEEQASERLDAELAAIDADLPSEEGSAAEAGSGGAGVPEVPVSTDPAAPEEKSAPPEDRGFERLVEREVALQAREQAFAQRESQMARFEAKIKALEARAVPEDLMDKFETSPEEAMREMGLDPENVVRTVIANRLGDKADPQLRQTIESAKIKSEIHALKAQLHEQQRAAGAKAFVAQVEAGAREYVNKGIGENAPTVAAIAKVNGERVFREIMEEISRDANDKMTRGLGGDVLTYEEAAKRVEGRWSEFRTMLNPVAPSEVPVKSASMPVSEKPVQGAVKPNPPATKPPDRPIAPWLRREALEDEGVKAGMAEYKRAEGLGKR